MMTRPDTIYPRHLDTHLELRVRWLDGRETVVCVEYPEDTRDFTMIHSGEGTAYAVADVTRPVPSRKTAHLRGADKPRARVEG